MKVPHDWVAGVVQAPSPSHVELGVWEELVAQLASLHLMPTETYAHFPDLHVPVVPHVDDGVTGHTPWGSGAPSATAVQIPSDAERLHAMQAPVQAALQQIPWAQEPDWHSFPELQSAPCGLSPQEPLTQVLPAAHCVLSLVHDL